MFSLVFTAHPVVSCFRSKQWLLSNGVESATGGSVVDVTGAALAGIEPILQHVPKITEAGVASGGGNATGGNATDGVAVARAIPSKSAAPTSSTTMLKSSSPASEPSTESLMSPSDFPSNAGVPGQPTFCMHSSLVSCFFHFLY